MSFPHGYYRIIEVIDNESFCMNSRDLNEITIIEKEYIKIDLNQFNLLYTIIIAYIIPLISIVTCYLIMITKLIKEKPVVS